MPRRIRTPRITIEDRLRPLPDHIRDLELMRANGWGSAERPPADWRTRRNDGRNPMPAAVRRLGSIPAPDPADPALRRSRLEAEGKREWP